MNRRELAGIIVRMPRPKAKTRKKQQILAQSKAELDRIFGRPFNLETLPKLEDLESAIEDARKARNDYLPLIAKHLKDAKKLFNSIVKHPKDAKKLFNSIVRYSENAEALIENIGVFLRTQITHKIRCEEIRNLETIHSVRGYAPTLEYRLIFNG